ncbi:MAG: YceG family protein [Clostridiales bacterium]|nr:YceG family protein [Clostridiales bacterium]
MLEHKKIQNLNDYFKELNLRREKGVYFYRINGYSDEIAAFIKTYYNETRKKGVVIEGRISNPTENNLAYYSEIMGFDFQMNKQFITEKLKKWLPRMNESQTENISEALYTALDSMRKSGKTDAMLKNAYIKFMCWLYYKFERIVSLLGGNCIPKILYEGNISNYELILISILSHAGCDVVLLQYNGDDAYLKADRDSALSYNLSIPDMKPFPKEYCIKMLREEMKQDADRERLYGSMPSIANCTNAWMTGKGIEDIKKEPALRGSDERFFYNCFLRINGVEDRNTYAQELHQMQQELKRSDRKIVIVNHNITKPNPEEITEIRRKGSYEKADQLIMDLAGNISSSFNIQLQRIIRKAFVDTVLFESQKGEQNLHRLINKAVYLLCWLKRYSAVLFKNWKMRDISCFIYLGGCKDDNEAMFMRFLARTPVDVVILCPNRNLKCCLDDKLLYEINYPENMEITEYPEDSSQTRIGTTAYHAERDLDNLLYHDTGIYRNQQYRKANVICLQTMYEEIRILWDQELKYRPSFSVTDDIVNIPVIFAKVSGVKDGLIVSYWDTVKELITEDTLVIKSVPYITSTDMNPMKPYVAEFYKNGKLKTGEIKNHPKYPYGILREEMQDFMLDRLGELIRRKAVKGIGENGTEYTVIAQVLNLPKEIVRLIQKFDFTKKNPKLIYINVTEKVISLEDTIVCTFLNLIGFDVLFFVPTGYQSVEKYFNKNMMEEHQVGEYKYDMQVPELSSFKPVNTRHTWREKFFKRG